MILGAGLQGAALAYYLTRRGVKPLIVEREKVAAAASGKGGGFLARDWGDSITRKLHTVTWPLKPFVICSFFFLFHSLFVLQLV